MSFVFYRLNTLHKLKQIVRHISCNLEIYFLCLYPSYNSRLEKEMIDMIFKRHDSAADDSNITCIDQHGRHDYVTNKLCTLCQSVWQAIAIYPLNFGKVYDHL